VGFVCSRGNGRVPDAKSGMARRETRVEAFMVIKGGGGERLIFTESRWTMWRVGRKKRGMLFKVRSAARGF
jgi:hypothetical protein